MPTPMMLMILDGWGISEHCDNNAQCQARTPYLDHLFATYPHSRLDASGEAVGLPEGQQGNSEVGHLNLGAGRVIYQDLLRINRDIAAGTYQNNAAFLEVLTACKNEQKALHVMGLLSDGGVHSHQDHLFALLALAKDQGLERVFVHCFTDGRDVPPSSAMHYVARLEEELARLGVGQIASVSGRYYAMDRDRRMDRVERAWRALVKGEGNVAQTAQAAVQQSYDIGITDEFIVPTVMVDAAGKAIGAMAQGDAVIFYNYRADRAREITEALARPDFDAFARPDFEPSRMVTMTEYEAGMDRYVRSAYPPVIPENTLGAWLAAQNKRQIRIAETEKYAHVTFFFNGGVESPNPGEDRTLISSPKVATYDLQPEMSAAAVSDAVVAAIQDGTYDFILVNFANPDMVGHTGKLDAAIRAMEAVDVAVAKVSEALLSAGGMMLLCADHGNCEQMTDADGSPFTAHTTNQVPLLLVQQGAHPAALADGRLCDVAPTLLALMHLPIPADMTGVSLLQQ